MHLRKNQRRKRDKRRLIAKMLKQAQNQAHQLKYRKLKIMIVKKLNQKIKNSKRNQRKIKLKVSRLLRKRKSLIFLRQKKPKKT